MIKLATGLKIKVTHGRGVIVGFERFDSYGNTAPMALEHSEAREERIYIKLDEGHTWCYEGLYAAFNVDIEQNNPMIVKLEKLEKRLGKIRDKHYQNTKQHDYGESDDKRDWRARESLVKVVNVLRDEIFQGAKS